MLKLDKDIIAVYSLLGLLVLLSVVAWLYVH